MADQPLFAAVLHLCDQRRSAKEFDYADLLDVGEVEIKKDVFGNSRDQPIPCQYKVCIGKMSGKVKIGMLCVLYLLPGMEEGKRAVQSRGQGVVKHGFMEI